MSRILGRKVGRALREQGVLGTLRLIGRNLWHPLHVRLSPQLRAARRASLAFDADHGTDTAREVYLGELDLPPEAHARPYEPVDPALFRAMIGDLPVDRGTCTFADLGSGKGRAVILAAELGFARALGVEIAPSLHRIAQENLARFRERFATKARVESILGDATTCDLPPGPLVVLLHNPFGRVVVQAVADRLARRRDRPLFLAYGNPEHRAVFDGRAPWSLHAEGPGWVAYRAQ